MPTLYESTIAVFLHELAILTTLLKHGISHAASGAVTEQSLVDARLIADMQTLAYQIQRVSDTSKGFAVRVGKVEPVPFEDNEKSFPELLERIAKTVKFLEGVKEEDINSNEDSEVVLKTGGGELKFSAKSMFSLLSILVCG